MSAVFYAVIAAIAAGFYSYFQRLASPNVNQLFGALMVSAAALTIAALFLVFQLGKVRLFTNPVGMRFLLGAGAAARCASRGPGATQSCGLLPVAHGRIRLRKP